MTIKAAHDIEPQEGDADYDYQHGRIKGYVSVYELVMNKADKILHLAETDFPGMLIYVDYYICKMILPEKLIPHTQDPPYYRGSNETLKIARILFRMFAKQRLQPKPT